MVKAYVALDGVVITRFVNEACKANKIETVVMKSESKLMKEMRAAKPDLIFIQAAIIELAGTNIIAKIKEDPDLGRAHVVVTASRAKGAQFATKVGADSFLPIPFEKEQFNSILRSVLNKPRQVLFISDLLDKRAGLLKKLQKSKLEIITAEEGKKAMAVIEKEFPDLVICESTLKDISSAELCREIKNALLLHHIPVFVLSEDSNVCIVEECFEAGVHDILFPPFDSDDNIKKISSVTHSPVKNKEGRALVVDDSLMIRNLISKMLKQLGFIVMTASNGLEGLNIARTEKPDIITSDYDMPIMSGWEFCRNLTSDDRTKDIPVIMVTSRSSEIDRKKGELLGVHAYLTKPFKQEDLQAHVFKAIEEAKRKKEHKTLTKYVAKDTVRFVADVIDGSKAQDPEEKFITVLFSDICDFSPKCERHGPKKIVNFLNNFYEMMVDILELNNALIDKFIGDAIVARFDSGDRTKDAENAVAASLAMLASLNKINESALEEIKIRIGVNSGNVILGNIGCERHRLDYTMIGDNVNIAQRLEGIAPEQGCLISDSTYELVKNIVVVDEPMELHLKGKSKAVVAYPLLQMRKAEIEL